MNQKAQIASNVYPGLPALAGAGPVESVSTAMRQVHTLIQRIAPTDRPVLIFGPTGSGKDIAAQELHRQSPRASSPFVDVNCCSIPETLLEAELFGHERGAFTGAVSSRAGYFAQAEDGTLFLDEIGDLPLSLQPKLLRAIESGQFRSVGSSELQRFAGRIVAATHRDLAQMVREGRFREDLYYRLSVFTIRIPSLAQRREDIPLLVQYFAGQQRRSLQFTPDALARLACAAWPGNVRQLKNVIDRIAVLTDSPCLDVAMVESFLSEPSEPCGQDIDEAVARLLQIEGEDKMSAVEHLLLDKVLRDCAGNKTAAARMLGVNRKVIERRVQSQANSLKRASTLGQRAQTLLVASDYAAGSATLRSALAHLRALPPSEEERRVRFELLRQLALCMRAQQGWLTDEVLEVYAETLRVGRGMVSPTELDTLMFGNWTAHLMRLELAKARGLADEMRLRGLETGDADLQIDGCIALANTRFWLGEFEGTLELVDEIAALSNPQDSSVTRQGMNPATLVTMLEGLAAHQHGDVARAQAAYHRLQGLCGELTHAFSLAIALQGCAWMGCVLGTFTEVAEYGSRLLAISEGFPFYRGVGQILVGYARSMAGEAHQAEEAMRSGFHQHMSNQGGLLFHSFYSLLLSRHHVAHGEPDKAREQVELALRIAMEHRELAYFPELLCVHGKVLWALGEVEGAEAEIRSAVSTATAMGSAPALLEAEETLARLLKTREPVAATVTCAVRTKQSPSDCA